MEAPEEKITLWKQILQFENKPADKNTFLGNCRGNSPVTLCQILSCMFCETLGTRIQTLYTTKAPNLNVLL